MSREEAVVVLLLAARAHRMPAPLDAYYAAKAAARVQPGDLFWISGRRPF